MEPGTPRHSARAEDRAEQMPGPVALSTKIGTRVKRRGNQSLVVPVITQTYGGGSQR
jgi:hypothetical protein